MSVGPSVHIYLVLTLQATILQGFFWFFVCVSISLWRCALLNLVIIWWSVRLSVCSHVPRAHSTGYNSSRIILIFCMFVNIIMEMCTIGFVDNLMIRPSFGRSTFTSCPLYRLQYSMDYFDLLYVCQYHYKDVPLLNLVIIWGSVRPFTLCSLYRLQFSRILLIRCMCVNIIMRGTHCRAISFERHDW